MICQYSVQMDVIIIPNMTKNEPVVMRGRKYPASYRGPVPMPTRRRRYAWMDPIQDMFEGD
jgi:ribosomal protein S10